MIIIFTAGQLGNQIFQYSFTNNVKNMHEKIITSHCEYFDIFEVNKNKHIYLNKYSRFITRRVLKLLSKLRIITYISQKQEVLSGYIVDIDEFNIKKGLFKNIKFIDGFYQSKEFVTHYPMIKREFQIEATNFLSDIPKESQKIFVHIRRGDYLSWSVLGKNNPSLPTEYYKNQLEWFLKNYENPYFIFLSNDFEFVEKEFDYIKNKKISKNSVGVDLAIMTKCENGIVSNSTLSWWGAYMMRMKNKIFAPKYWLGWQSKIWYPKGIEADFMEYIEIKEKNVYTKQQFNK